EYGAIYQNPDSPYFQVVSGNNVNPRKGFVKYTVAATGISAQFIPSTTTSNFADSFRIVGVPPPPPPPTSTPMPVPTTAPTPTPTPPPSERTILIENFDDQKPGYLRLGSGVRLFSGDVRNHALLVENTIAESRPNGLAISALKGSAFAFKHFADGHRTEALQFDVRFGSHFALSPSSYLTLAQLAPGGSSLAGRVSLIMSGTKQLHLDYFDAARRQHYLWSSVVLTSGRWHTVSLADSVGAGIGALALTLDGTAILRAGSLNTGNAPIRYIDVGDEFSPNNSGISGHIYLDNVRVFAG
ncbi:MAG TPA: hypothetical protein VG815_08490, partial [Chloroflexota bacterium]|nr:hypothetical protein [Chloroflexota bacterium]